MSESTGRLTSFLMRLAVAAAMLAPLLPAQFGHLATDATGDRVWFSSRLRLDGTDQHLHEKLFMADATGRVVLAAARPLSNPYHLLGEPEVSGDGSVLAYRAAYCCSPGITCKVDEPWRGVIAAAGEEETEVAGKLRISRNGRYLLRHSYRYFGPSGEVELIDRQTGEGGRIPIAGFVPLTGGRVVSSRGAALVYADGLWLVRIDGGFEHVPSVDFSPPDPHPFFSQVLRATMDDAGRKVVYQTTHGASRLMIVTPGDDSSLRELVAADEGATDPVMSADGARVLILARGNLSAQNPAGLQQAWIVYTGTGELRRITSDPAGIAEATLSGDGEVAWAVTYGGRLLQIRVDTGEAREVIPQTTAVDQNPVGAPLRAAPGALVSLRGRGLAPEYAASGLPLATELNGVRLLADGRALPLLFVSPSEIVFQAPWELSGTLDLTLAAAGSPFEEQVTRRLQVMHEAVEVLRTADGSSAIAHGDFRGLITAEDPARPGEVIHLYLTGMGAVAPPAETGEAAPVEPLSMVTGPLFAAWGGQIVGSLPSPQILFAGLAPGMVGVYQVSLALPDGLLPPELGLTIQVGGSGVFLTIPIGW